MSDAATASAPKRPVLRWHGGKWRLAPWIIGHFPPHRIYVEPFGGAGSVLLRKPRVYAEVYNDLDDEVVGLFRVLQDDASAARLIHLLKVTPFARAEFRRAWEPCDDAIEAARRLVVRAYMGFGTNAHAMGPVAAKTGFRANTRLYGAAARACFALGYRRIGTYILASEPGASLRASGWRLVAGVPGRSWSAPSRPRVDKHPLQDKLLYERDVG